MTLTYVYCVVASHRRPPVRPGWRGVPGSARLRALDAGNGCWIIASDVPDSEYGETALEARLRHFDWVAECALGHEAVVERFLRARAVLPLPLFTIFISDDRAVQSIAGRRRRLDRLLLRVERRHEWGLRVMLDEGAARGAGETPVPGSGRGRTPESGAAYLARKRRELAGNRDRLARARAEGNRLYRELAREASAAVKRAGVVPDGASARLVVDAAFLVPVARTGAFRTAVRRHARGLDKSLVVSLTGPWPPYTFVSGRSRGPRP